jgi:hypothetical protein
MAGSSRAGSPGRPKSRPVPPDFQLYHARRIAMLQNRNRRKFKAMCTDFLEITYFVEIYSVPDAGGIDEE